VGASPSTNDGMMLEQNHSNQSDDAFGMFLSSDSMSELGESPAMGPCSRGQQFSICATLPRTQDNSTLPLGQSYMPLTPDEDIPFSMLDSPNFQEQPNFELHFEHGHSHINQCQLQPSDEHGLLDLGQKSANESHQQHLSSHQLDRQQSEHHLSQVSTDDTLQQVQLQTRVLATNDRGRSTPRRSTSPINNLVLPSPASTARSQINRNSASPCQGLSANFVPKRPASALSSWSPSAQGRRSAGHTPSFSSGAANLRDHHVAYTTSPRYLNTYNAPSANPPPAMPSFDQQRPANNAGESEGRYASAAHLSTQAWSINTSCSPAHAAQGTSEEARSTQPSYFHTGSGAGDRSLPPGFCPQCACQRRDPAGGGSPRYVTIRVPVDSLLAIA
jgi:hypothetical protein